MKRIPLPKVRPPGVNRVTWWRARKRGYLTVDYHVRESVCDGPDHFGHVVGNPLAFSGRQARWVLAQWGLAPGQEREVDRALSWDDLVQEGATRCVELRSHPNGEGNWRFYASAAMRAQSTMLRHGRHRGGSPSLEDSIDVPARNGTEQQFFADCYNIVLRKDPQAAQELLRWRADPERPVPAKALKILKKELAGKEEQCSTF